MNDELMILRIETACNTPDKTLIRNLKATKERNTPLAPFVFEPLATPLLVCGSGPSLSKFFPLARLMYPNAPIMALNGAYKALLEMGVIPNYYVQLDAQPANVNFVERASAETTFMLASQCAPEMFEALKDFEVQTYHLNTPTTRTVFPEAKVYFGGGSTVGTTALGLAAGLGYRCLVLLGYDSSYADGKSHALPQPQNAGQKTLDVWVDDVKFTSTPTMAKQVEEFRPWIKGLEHTFPGLEVRLAGEGLLYHYLLTGQSKSLTREEEAAKYTQMYKEENYRMPQHRIEGITNILADLPRGTLLDVGTGRGETLDIAEGLGYQVRGTETVDYLIESRPEKVVKALLPTLPFQSKGFDTVTNFEVIEHLLPMDVLPALRELERVAKDRVIISAATCSDFRAGVELHPSYRTENEWEETFKHAWGVEAKVRKIGNLSSLGFSPVYEYEVRQ